MKKLIPCRHCKRKRFTSGSFVRSSVLWKQKQEEVVWEEPRREKQDRGRQERGFRNKYKSNDQISCNARGGRKIWEFAPGSSRRFSLLSIRYCKSCHSAAVLCAKKQRLDVIPLWRAQGWKTEEWNNKESHRWTQDREAVLSWGLSRNEAKISCWCCIDFGSCRGL